MASAGLTEQQKEAVVSVDKNVLVSAGAGSGKTHVLVERYVELLRTHPDVSVDMIVAVTFTRKAAGEMRNRLKLKFKELAEAESENVDRWQKCLADIDLAKIGTIHSLCESTLKAFPAEAGIDPQFEVVDDVTQTELIDESVTHAFRQAVEDGAEEANILVELNIDEVRRWTVSNLKAGIQFKESYRRMIGLEPTELLTFMNDIRATVQRDLIAELLASKDWLEAIEYLDNETADGKLETQRVDILEAQKNLGAIGGAVDDPRSFRDVWAKAWRVLLTFNEINLRIGGNKDAAKAMKKPMKKLRTLAQDVVGELPAEIDERDLESFRFCQWLVNIFERAEIYYQERKESTLVLDYNDLISLTLRLLKAPDSAARKYFQNKLHAILVDEFQDTNSLQAELVSLLAGPRTRLFLIGDDKQSIYKFQGADVSTFNSWRNLMRSEESASGVSSNLPGERLSTKLTVSFRSHPRVVEFVNFIFDRIFVGSDGETSYHALFEPLKATRLENGDCQRANIELVVMPSLDEEGEKIDRYERKRTESLAVADWIDTLIAEKAPLLAPDGEVLRPLSYGDFAVLVSKNSDFDFVEYGLAKKGIPYNIFAGRGFLNRQEIIDIENLLNVLSNPADSHSLLGVLRSPLFAVSDDVIHELAAGLKGSLWTTLATSRLVSKPGYESLRRARVYLRGFMEDKANLSLSELIRRIIVKTNYELVLLGGSNGIQRSRNLFKLVSIAREHENLSCGEFAYLLKQMREFEIKQSDAPIGTSDSVKIMTIHASKGLEFPAVALPALGSPLVRGASRLLFHPTYGISINPQRNEKDDKPAWFNYAAKLDTQMELAERRRLLYVAMTRARDYLGIFVEQDDSRKETFRNWILTALDFDSSAVDPENPAQQELVSSAHRAVFTSRFYSAEGSSASAIVDDSSSVSDMDVGKKSPEAGTGESSLEMPARISDLPLLERVFGEEAELPPVGGDSSRVTPAKDSAIVLPANLVGTYFHKLMECVTVRLTEPPSAELFESVAFELGVMVSHPDKRALLISEGKNLMDLFFASKLHTKMVMAKALYEEFPYLLLGSEGVVLSKRPDLILQDEDERWYIIDFKTDDFPRDAMQSHINRHRRQLMSYVRDMEKLTGIKYTPAVYFARHGEFSILVEGEADSPERPEYKQLNLFSK